MGVIGFAHHDRYCLFFERSGDMSVKVHLKLLRYLVDFEGKRSPQNALVPEPSTNAVITWAVLGVRKALRQTYAGSLSKPNHDRRRNSSVFLVWSRFSSPSSSKR